VSYISVTSPQNQRSTIELDIDDTNDEERKGFLVE
jgi:hypothetical protein